MPYKMIFNDEMYQSRNDCRNIIQIDYVKLAT